MINRETEPKISVIVPVYNVEKYLNRCIDSLISQTYSNLEIILIDDGSSDKSGEICDAYAQGNDRIKVLHQENKGLPGARNSGVEIATGDYIGFVDSDDFVELDMYKYLIELAKKNDADIACCGVKRIFDGGRRVEKSSYHDDIAIMDREQAFEEYQLYNSIGPAAWNKIFKKELFQDLKFRNYKRLEDSWVVCQCISKASKLAYEPYYGYNYMIRNNSITHTNFSEKTYDIITVTDENYKVFKKQFPDNPMAEIGRILWYVVFINEMIVGKGYDIHIINAVQKMIKDSRNAIMENMYLDKIRKRQLFILGNSFSLYKTCYLIYMRITGK